MHPESTMTLPPWTFIHIADMQPGSPKSFRFRPAWLENWHAARRQIISLNPDFLLIGGDVTRDGAIHPWELEDMKVDLDAMAIPYHVVPGNMDTGNKHTDRQGPYPDRDDVSLNITSEHLANWTRVFGDWKWSFTHKNLRVSGFCDMIVNSGLPEERDLWSWLDAQRALPRAEHHLWLMHYALFTNTPDEPNWNITRKDQYHDWYFSIDLPGRQRLLDVFRDTGATRVITGHIHCRKDMTAHNIAFDLAPTTASGQWAQRWPDGDTTLGFLQYRVEGKTIDKQFIPLENPSTRTDGYGPGGHPLPTARDYSLAWETSPPALANRPVFSRPR